MKLLKKCREKLMIYKSYIFEKNLNTLKEKFAHDIPLAIPNPNYPFHIHADSSNLGTGCILIQQFPDRKRIVSTNFSTQYFRRCSVGCKSKIHWK